MYIARQPILRRDLEIYGYELLYRAKPEMMVFSGDSFTATASVINTIFENGFSKVVADEKAFVNFDYDFIMSDFIELLDPNGLIIEILETVYWEEALIARIRDLRQKGYHIALDDFPHSHDVENIVEYADIIKYDIIKTPLDTIEEEVRDMLGKRKVLVAEKIETMAEFERALNMGFHLFQGFFFCKPQMMTDLVPIKVKDSMSIYVKILHEIRKENYSFDRLTELIESNLNISYKLMKIVSWKDKTTDYKSIKHALVKLGMYNIDKWIQILMLQDCSSESPAEVYRLALIRAKFGEYIASQSRLIEKKEEIAMMCLFSLLDIMLKVSMQIALEDIQVTKTVEEALIHKRGCLVLVSKLIQAYENGNWKTVDRYSQLLGVNPQVLGVGYVNALKWADGIFNLNRMKE